jgi:hypothetical protein
MANDIDTAAKAENAINGTLGVGEEYRRQDGVSVKRAPLRDLMTLQSVSVRNRARRSIAFSSDFSRSSLNTDWPWGDSGR